MSECLDFRRLNQLINAALTKDQHTFRQQLKRLSKTPDNERLIVLLARVEESAATAERRRDQCPAIDYPDLPISHKREDIAALIDQHQVVILCGETGSGKTTQLPKICLELGRGFKGQIGHTQPRRLAAISVAQRIADELKTELGQTVGYKIRFQGKENEHTLVKLMTDGILLAEIKSDQYLSHYDTLILDEAHERSLNIDFLLGYMKWLLPKRPDLKLIVTSATIDPERFSKHFNGAPIINVSGRTYPVEMRYHPVGADAEQSDRDMPQAIVDAAAELHRERAGDILVFLSGEREIREATDALRKHHPPGYDILPLYSRLSAKEQSQIFKPHKKPRIVLATNVAETSLTVPGIRCVIDTGLARISRFSQRSKIQQLPIEPISQASANQRSGRCGREAAGICIRLYSEDDFKQRAEFTQPEILRTNLASVILQMKSLKLSDVSQFPFLEPPADKVIRSGIRHLHELGALDDGEKLTLIGKRLTQFPLDPQLGRMLLAAEEFRCLDEVLTIVAALSIQDPRERPMDKAKYADAKHKTYQNESSDFLSFLTLWKEFQAQKKVLSNNKFRQYCRENFLSYMRLKDWEDIRRQLLDVVKGNLGLKLNISTADDDAIHQALLSGLVTRIGVKQDQAEYLGARNLKFYIHPASSLFKKQPKWLMAAEQVETTRVYGRTVAVIKPEWVEKAAPHLIKRQYYEPHWSKKVGQAMVYEQLQLFGLTISKGRKVPLARTEPTAARELFIRNGLVEREMLCHAPFFKKNEQLLASIEYEQQKGRRVDLLIDEQSLFEFYEDKLPEQINSLAALNSWLKKDNNNAVLELSEDDVTSNDKASTDPDNFPDSRLINGVAIKLSYRFEPAHEEDGVTANIPLAQLNQLSSQPFDWLVPGLYAEKLQALIKGLPKNLRKQFVPVPNFVTSCLNELDYSAGGLLDALASSLNKQTSSTLKASDFELDKLPAHLRMNFHIIGDKGEVIAASKDFATLKRQYTKKAGQQFQAALTNALSMSGSKNWQFNDIAKHHTIEHEGRSLQGFLTLVDEQDSVGLTVVDSEEEAEKSHQAGLIRLFRLKFSKELKQLSRQSVITTAQAFGYLQLKPHPECELDKGEDIFDDLAHQLMSSTFQNKDIRTEEEFDTAIERLDASVYSTGYALSETVAKLLSLHQKVRQDLSTWEGQPLHKDVTKQLSRLFFQGFVRHVPAEKLMNYARYLRAIEARLDKAKGQIQKDVEKAALAQRYESLFWQAVKTSGEHLESVDFRWLLEEYRISLFAQQIKTTQPVSEKRLEKAWASLY
tara:strand:+ start:48875 stop:52729 length:3855 start_codon:yes stop_codon:yes gene_type:complete